MAGAVLILGSIFVIWSVRRAERLKKEAAKEKSRKDQSKLENILHQFNCGQLPFTSAEIELGQAGGEADSCACALEGGGNYLALTTPYDHRHYEIPTESVYIKEWQVLGSGEFGVVYGGLLQIPHESCPDPIEIGRASCRERV